MDYTVWFFRFLGFGSFWGNWTVETESRKVGVCLNKADNVFINLLQLHFGRVLFGLAERH